MKAQQENWKQFNEIPWIQNGRNENRHFGTTKWFISDHGYVKREYYDLEGQLVKSIEVNQYWKGKSKKYLCIPTGEYIHRLVAQHFIPNPQNLRLVLFIDGDLENTHVSNLIWSDGIGHRKGQKYGPRRKNKYFITN
jgi:hypothetical protein